MADDPGDGPITPEMERFALTLVAAFPGSQNAGIYAFKPGFHSTVDDNLENWPSNYSIAYPVLRSAPTTRARAFDLMFPEAQRGDYTRINLVSQRLMDASLRRDPRLVGVVYEWFGTRDGANIGYNIFKNRPSSSDDTHDWHNHISIETPMVNNWPRLWGVAQVMMGIGTDDMPKLVSPADGPRVIFTDGLTYRDVRDQADLNALSALSGPIQKVSPADFAQILSGAVKPSAPGTVTLTPEQLAELGQMISEGVLDPMASAAEAAASVLRDAAGDQG